MYPPEQPEDIEEYDDDRGEGAPGDSRMNEPLPDGVAAQIGEEVKIEEGRKIDWL